MTDPQYPTVLWSSTVTDAMSLTVTLYGGTAVPDSNTYTDGYKMKIKATNQDEVQANEY